MNLTAVFTDSFRITRTAWALWVMNGLLIFVLFPTVVLAVLFGGLSAALALPFLETFPEWVRGLQNLPGWAWVLLSIVGLVLLIITSAASAWLQAAAMHGTAIAAEQGKVSWGEAFNLGQRRLTNILKLSLAYGALTAILALIPPILGLMLRRQEWGVMVEGVFQTFIAPINTVLNLALLLVMLSVALEDLNPSRAFGRAWEVFKTGWWGFLLVFGGSGLIGLGVVLFMSFLALIMFLPAAVIMPFAPTLGGIVFALCCALFSPLGLVALIGTMVFTTVTYTLFYREAARSAGATPST